MTTLQGTVRTFIAIELPVEVQQSLHETQERLVALLGGHSGALRWARTEGLHLTLQFLGDLPIRLIGLAKQTIDKACAGTAPFTLTTGEVGVFPNERRPRVLWVGAGGDLEPLHRLATSVHRELRALGYKPDTAFSPHLTLARVKGHIEDNAQQSLSNALSQIQREGLPHVSFPVSAVSLMQSDLRPGGPVYTRLRLTELK